MLPKLTLTCNSNDKVLLRPGFLVAATNVHVDHLICFENKLDLRIHSYAHYKLFKKVESITIDNENDTICFGACNHISNS